MLLFIHHQFKGLKQFKALISSENFVSIKFKNLNIFFIKTVFYYKKNDFYNSKIYIKFCSFNKRKKNVINLFCQIINFLCYF